MSTATALRQVAVVLAATGNLVPGVAGSPPPAGVRASPSRPTTDEPVETAGPDVDVLRASWTWPLDPRPAVTAPYVPPRSTYGAGHRGLDVAASPGHAVRAVAEGVVSHVGVVAGRGSVTVTHATGLRSTYEPVRGTVTTGSTVAQGGVIGVVEGRTHCGGGCLHLGAVRGSGYVDPRPLLRGGPVVLLPMWSG